MWSDLSVHNQPTFPALFIIYYEDNMIKKRDNKKRKDTIWDDSSPITLVIWVTVDIKTSSETEQGVIFWKQPA